MKQGLNILRYHIVSLMQTGACASCRRQGDGSAGTGALPYGGMGAGRTNQCDDVRIEIIVDEDLLTCRLHVSHLLCIGDLSGRFMSDLLAFEDTDLCIRFRITA